MKGIATTLVMVAALTSTLFAAEDAVPKGVPHLDHVFVIVMENHGFGQIVNNPDAPFANELARKANSALNYFAIGHPSSTNYLEIVGGSNFGVRSDNPPDWHASCTTNLASGTPNLDAPTSSGPVCPIAGSGMDAATPATDTTNECPNSPAPCDPGTWEVNIDGSSIPAAPTVGKSIADQLDADGRSWKSYQESLPPTGANNIAYSDGFFTDNPDIHPVPAGYPSLVKLYAAKHNPFVYFRSAQENPRLLNRTVGFEGKHGLFEDLASGRVPHLSFIVPNQCNDQHGRSNAGAACNFDPNDNGTQTALNPGLIYVGDLTLRNLVKAIHSSPAWHDGKNAIVVVWDENDYSVSKIPTFTNVNKVLLIVDTNYGVHGKTSSKRYTHFSLLKTLEAGFGLPCLNHACDENSHVMSDLFAGSDQDEQNQQ